MVHFKHVVAKTHQSSKSIFQSLEAKNQFRTVTGEKNVIPEKGFHSDCLVPTTSFTFISNVVTSLQWEKFFAPRGLPDIDLIREFYANLWETSSSVMYIHGRMVPFSAQAINNLFSLPTLAQDGYAAALASPNDAIFQQILQMVAMEGTEWTYSCTQRIRNCKRQDLRNETKLWFYFIRYSVIPAMSPKLIKNAFY